jgi:hypothetical protein
MRTVGLFCTAIGALALVSCSDAASEGEQRAAEMTADLEAQQAASSPQERYDRAVECAATTVNVANVFNVIASTDEDSNPAQAERARSSANENMAQARAFAQLAEQIAADPAIGKSRDEVVQDIDAIDRQIRQRGQNAEDFMGFATQIAREADACDADQISAD